MARIAGIDLPRDKRVEVALTYIFGIGRPSANKILKKANVNKDTHVQKLAEQRSYAFGILSTRNTKWRGILEGRGDQHQTADGYRLYRGFVIASPYPFTVNERTPMPGPEKGPSGNHREEEEKEA